MYIALAVKKTMVIEVMGQSVELPFSSAGFFGMCPVFETKEKADEWAGGKCQVVCLTSSSS